MSKILDCGRSHCHRYGGHLEASLPHHNRLRSQLDEPHAWERTWQSQTVDFALVLTLSTIGKEPTTPQTETYCHPRSLVLLTGRTTVLVDHHCCSAGQRDTDVLSLSELVGHMVKYNAATTWCMAGLVAIISAQRSSTETADVIIYGGTPAGIAAAVQLARLNHTVIIINPLTDLGGMMSGECQIIGTLCCCLPDRRAGPD